MQAFVLNLFALLPFAVIAAATVHMFSEANANSSATKSSSAIMIKRSPAVLAASFVIAAVAGVATIFADGGVSVAAARTSLVA